MVLDHRVTGNTGLEEDLPIDDVQPGPSVDVTRLVSVAVGNKDGLDGLPEEQRRYFYTGIIPFDIPALLSAARCAHEPLGKVPPRPGDYIPRFYMDAGREVPDPLKRFLTSHAEDAFITRRKLLRADRALMSAAASGITGILKDHAIATPDPKKDPALYREVSNRLRLMSPDDRQRLRAACTQLIQATPGLPLESLKRTLYILHDMDVHRARRPSSVR